MHTHAQRVPPALRALLSPAFVPHCCVVEAKIATLRNASVQHTGCSFGCVSLSLDSMLPQLSFAVLVLGVMLGGLYSLPPGLQQQQQVQHQQSRPPGSGAPSMSGDLPVVCVDREPVPELLETLKSQFRVLLVPQFNLGASGVSVDDAAAVVAFVIVGFSRVNAAVLASFPNVKVIATLSVGIDHITVADTDAAGVLVGNTPKVIAGATADIAFGLLLAVARNVVAGDKSK